MAVLESADYQAARERLKGNPIISMMAAGLVTVPLAELAHQDGTPRSHLMSQANRAFDDAEARNAGNPDYSPDPRGASRHIGLIAEAVLAGRAEIRATVASVLAPPGTSPEADEVTAIIERMQAARQREPGPARPAGERPATENQAARPSRALLPGTEGTREASVPGPDAAGRVAAGPGPAGEEAGR
jgi:hypothetical protein